MPKYTKSATLKKALAEPIEFEFGDKTYVINKVTPALVQKFADMAPDEDAAKNLKVSAVGDLLRTILQYAGCEVVDLPNVDDLDMREVKPLMEWIGNQITADLGGKEKNSLESAPALPEPSPASTGVTN
jgi:hypothetical protein